MAEQEVAVGSSLLLLGFGFVFFLKCLWVRWGCLCWSMPVVGSLVVVDCGGFLWLRLCVGGWRMLEFL